MQKKWDVLLEALMNERIYLKCGIDFAEPYGPYLKKIEDEKVFGNPRWVDLI